MFNSQAANSLKGNSTYEHTPRRRLFRRRETGTSNVHQSPAKRLLSLLKLGITPSKKMSKQKTSSKSRSSSTANDGCKGKSSSYTEKIAPNDGESLTPTISPSSSLSPHSEIGITNLPGWANATADEMINFGVQDRLPPPALSLSVSPVGPTTPRRCLFQRQESDSSVAEMMLSPYHLDRSQDFYQDNSMQDISMQEISQDISHSYYDFDLNHHYDFDQDGDLATERHRYMKGKVVHIDGVEITAEEKEFTKSFNRIKLDRRPRRKNRRKAKHFSSISGKNENILKLEDEFENIRL